MKVRVSHQRAQMVLDKFAEWLPDYAERFERMASRCKLGLTIELKPVRRRRSHDQNARYWAIVAELADYVGLEKEEMHREVLCEFWGYDLKRVFGRTIKVPKGRSHNLSTTEFSDLMEIADRWAAEAGIGINY